jgi:hypothetical protein
MLLTGSKQKLHDWEQLDDGIAICSCCGVSSDFGHEVDCMTEEKKMLWGLPVVESEEMSKGIVIFGPLPTAEDLMRHGSLENAVEYMKHQYAKIALDDEILAASEIE